MSRLTEEDKHRIIYGYDKVEPFVSTDSINYFCDEMYNRFKLGINSYPFGVVDNIHILQVGRNFLNECIKLNKVPYLKEGFRTYAISKVRNNKVISAAKLCEVLSMQIDPYDLPIYFIEDNDSKVGLCEIMDVSDRIKVINEMKVYYAYIKLKKENSIIGAGDYVHEIIHTQLDHTGVIKNYYNSEVLSIFFELLFGISMDGGSGPITYTNIVNRIADIIRSNRMVNRFDFNKEDEFKEHITSAKYVNSIFKAFGLLDCYFNSGDLDRYNMMNNIQLVIDGKKTLEDLLNYYNLDIDNSVEKARGFMV